MGAGSPSIRQSSVRNHLKGNYQFLENFILIFILSVIEIYLSSGPTLPNNGTLQMNYGNLAG